MPQVSEQDLERRLLVSSAWSGVVEAERIGPGREPTDNIRQAMAHARRRRRVHCNDQQVSAALERTNIVSAILHAVKELLHDLLQRIRKGGSHGGIQSHSAFGLHQDVAVRRCRRADIVDHERGLNADCQQMGLIESPVLWQRATSEHVTSKPGSDEHFLADPACSSGSSHRRTGHASSMARQDRARRTRAALRPAKQPPRTICG